MASTVLPNGIIIPEKYSRDWYNDLYHNWQELDNLLGGGTPKDGTLTIQKNGATVGTFSANQATNETINITVPDVNNGTLTIQQNGTTVDTFTANSSSDKTVNIEVPTKTSDLTNDSGFITGVSWNDVADKPSFATVATSGSYTDLSDKPTIPTVNNATLTIQQNGTTVDSFSANSSSDKTVNIQCVDLTSNQTVAGDKEFTGTTTAHDIVPSATGTYNFGSSAAQWNNAYIKSLTINGVAAGDILTHNASEFVNVSGNQTIGGIKTFSEYIRIQGSYNGNEASSNARTVLEFRSNRDTADKSGIYLSKFRQNKAQGEMGDNDNQMLAIDVLENGVRTNNLFRFTFKGWVNDVPTKAYLEPFSSNTQAFLGTASRSWEDIGTKAINGINPGALSLPDNSKSVVIDTTNWDVAGGANVYTPPANGWLHIRVTDATELAVRWTDWIFGDRRVSATATDLGVTIPVVAGVTVDVITVASNFNNKCQFFPCRGNI